MATFQIKCGECGKAISPDMKAAMRKKECPYCGTPVKEDAFEALEVAANMEQVMANCGERIGFAARKASIMKMLADAKLPLVEMIPEETDRVAPAPPLAQPASPLMYPPGTAPHPDPSQEPGKTAAHPDPTKEPGKTAGLDRTVSVGQRGGRPGTANASQALSREEEGLNLQEKAVRRARRFSGGGVEFGEMPIRLRTPAGAATGPGKKLSDIPDRPNPLQMAQSEGIGAGAANAGEAFPDAVPDTVIPDEPAGGEGAGTGRSSR